MARLLPAPVRALLSLTRHADDPGPLCRHCLHQQIREELSSLSRAQDRARLAQPKPIKKGAPC